MAKAKKAEAAAAGAGKQQIFVKSEMLHL